MDTPKRKIGDLVRVLRCTCSIKCTADEHQKDVGKVGKILKITDDIHYYVIEGMYAQFNDGEVEPALKSWDYLQVGDIILDDDGEERRVYGVTGEMVAVDDGQNDGRFDTCWVSVPKLRDYFKYTIKQESPTEEVTELSVAELEKKLDIPAGTLRVKKD